MRSSTRLSPKQTALITAIRGAVGGAERYRSSLNSRLVYTPSIRCLAELADAYWLVDAIAEGLDSETFQRAALRNPAIGISHCWTLEVALDRSAVLIGYSEPGKPAFFWRDFDSTDLCLPRVDLCCGFDGRRWTLFMPGDH